MKKIVGIFIAFLFIGVGVIPNISSFELVGGININGELNSPLELHPTDDSYIGLPTGDSNNGDLSFLAVRNMYGYTPGWECDTLIRFDLSSIQSEDFVASAKLCLYYYEQQYYPAGRELTCHRITSYWDEGSVTYNTRPKISASVTDSSVVPSTYSWMEWDVTNDVKDFISEQNDNYGWQIMDEEYWGWFDIPSTYFCSKEYSDSNFHPYLEVEMDQPPNAPSNPDPSNHAIDVDINTDLSWSGGDPDIGDTVTYDVYFGSMLPLPKVASNITTTVFDPGTLVNSLTYFWSIVAWDNHGAPAVGPGWDFTTIKASSPPNKPDKPYGTTSGKTGITYSYSSITTDPDGDDIYYWFDWGDETNSGWVGTYNSGDSISLGHKWTNVGTYPIRVKARDVYGAESVWSEYLSVSMPKDKMKYQFNILLERFFHRFSFFEKILNQIV